MRFGALPAFVVLGASLVVATPIRVVVTEVTSSGRFDHVEAISNVGAMRAPIMAYPVAQPIRFDSHSGNQHSRPCASSMRSKALDASNALRQWFGFEAIQPPVRVEPIETHSRRPPKDVAVGAGELPVLPFVGTPVRPAWVMDQGAVVVGDGNGSLDSHRQGNRPMWIHRHHQSRGSFLRRVHHALMSLGPWEGRAVAFVLGCGIGVLLRMVWVMVLVAARAIRGTREEETEYEVVFDESEMLVPPPQYTMIEGSEAVPVPVDEKSDKE